MAIRPPPLTSSDQPLLWDMLYLALYVPDGAALLRHLLKAAQPRYRVLSLSVAVDNPALRLYSRLGFEGVRVDGQSLIMLRRSAGGDATHVAT